MRIRGLVVMGALLVACSGTGGTPAPAPQADGPLAQSFDTSAQANAVPRDLLVAIAQVEGGLTMPATRDVAPDAQVPVAGPLELRHGAFDSLARGAALMGTSELALRQDTDTGLEAGARVLAELGAAHGARAVDLGSWNDAIEELSGFSDEAHRKHYAHEVFALLASGGTFPGRDGESVTIAPHPELPPTLTLDVSDALHTLGTAEYPGAEWIPTSCTNKCDTTRGGATVQYVVIHDTEGGWNASVATLQNDPGKSVQYIVNTDGHVAQFVPESYTAWHAGNYWYNQRSVGIEHVGYYKQPYPEAQYASSAKLVAYLTAKYKVTKDRAHIIGHDQVPNGNVMAQSSPACSKSPSACETGSSYGGAGNHRDPGVWEWCTYMPRFGGTCKCNDIWNLWNCSSDHTKAFRCVNGQVQLETCDGPGACESKPTGQNDVCNQAPPSGDAGVPPGGNNGLLPLPPPQDGGAAAAPGGDTSQAGGGCSTAPGSRGDAVALGLLTAALILSRKRRRS